MNYLDYRNVMRDENLQESELVQFFLEDAKRQQRLIKSLKFYGLVNFPGYHRTLVYKDEAIMNAIETARIEKELGYKTIEEGEAKFAEYALKMVMMKKKRLV